MRLISIVLFAAACSTAGADPTPTPKPAPPAKLATKLSVTTLEPKEGDVDGGTYLRISGTGFLADGPRNLKIYFGSRQGAVVRFASDSEVIVQAPGGKVGEIVDVLCLFEPGGELKLSKAFTFVDKTAKH